MTLNNTRVLLNERVFFTFERLSDNIEDKMELNVESFYPFVFFLKNHVLTQYIVLTDLTPFIEDVPGTRKVLYELFSFRYKKRILIEIVTESTSVDFYYPASTCEFDLISIYSTKFVAQ